ncbi:MAG TPA: transglutaminase-like domain-containing protein [Candidatus Acidoferrales bacterium]
MSSNFSAKKGYFFQSAIFSVNMLLISSALLILFGIGWEYSTRLYLSGFSNAVLPYTSSPEKKVTAILEWMQQGPTRSDEFYSDDTQDRDPIDTLNYKELLTVCGTATNAFVNLASAGGIEARRLLLLDERGLNTNHVVAEVHIDGRWVIADPSFHALLRSSKDGHLLTRQELARPEVLSDATRDLPGYDPAYNYQHPAFIHIARLPIIGNALQSKTNSILPSWQESINWTVLLERPSYDTLVVGIILLCFGICLRQLVFWYGRKNSLVPMSPWELLRDAGVSLFSSPDSVKVKKSLDAA